MTCLMTLNDELTILDEYFERSVSGSGCANDAEGLEKLWFSNPESGPITEGALIATHHPPIAEINAVHSEASDILDPDVTVASAAMSVSSSSIGSSEPGSMSMNPTSYPPSEAHYINSDLASVVQHACLYPRTENWA
jgi:hypothetical protein